MSSFAKRTGLCAALLCAIAVVPAGARSVVTTPQTTIGKEPDVVRAAAAKAPVKLRFSSSETAVRFECSVDIKPYRPCVSPKTYHLAVGRHTFRVRAIGAGGADPTPATKSVRVKSA